MAKRQTSFADGFTVESLLAGSDSPPTGAGTPRSFGGAPVLYSIDRGERALATGDQSTKRVYPPVYGGGNRQVETFRSKRSPKGNVPGYIPTSTDITNSPNPF